MLMKGVGMEKELRQIIQSFRCVGFKVTSDPKERMAVTADVVEEDDAGQDKDSTGLRNTHK